MLRGMSEVSTDCPATVHDFAEQAVEYVRRALGVTLAYDSETLPVLDHYISQIPGGGAAARDLVLATAGAYYGEVVRRHLGGRWQADGDPAGWRLVLPGALSFSPVAFVAAAMARGGDSDLDDSFQMPDLLRPLVETALEAMAPVSEAEYFSLCGRLDTLEHLLDCLYEHARQAEERRNASN
jgi:hypothetical protein